MSSRRVTLKPNKIIEPCPKCGQNQVFTARSEQIAEDCCEIWIACKCGYDPTEEDTNYRVEDVWGGVDDDNCRNALEFSWNEPIKERRQR